MLGSTGISLLTQHCWWFIFAHQLVDSCYSGRTWHTSSSGKTCDWLLQQDVPYHIHSSWKHPQPNLAQLMFTLKIQQYYLPNYHKPVVVICCRKQGMNWRITHKLTTPSVKISVVHIYSCQVLKKRCMKTTLLRGVTWVCPATQLKILTMFSGISFHFQREGNWFSQAGKPFWTEMVKTRGAKLSTELVNLPRYVALMKPPCFNSHP